MNCTEGRNVRERVIPTGGSCYDAPKGKGRVPRPSTPMARDPRNKTYTGTPKRKVFFLGGFDANDESWKGPAMEKPFQNLGEIQAQESRAHRLRTVSCQSRLSKQGGGHETKTGRRGGPTSEIGVKVKA